MNKSKKIISLCVAVILVGLSFGSINVGAAKRAKSRISINKKKVTICVGEKTRLKVNTKKKIVWKTSKKKVAKVNKKGLVSAIKPGKATITAKVGKKRLTCKVTVKEEPKLEYDNYTLCVNDSFVLQFEGEPKNVIWIVEDESIVTLKDMEFVENAVMVIGLKYGSTNVVAKVGKKEYKCNVSVEKTFQMDESQMNVTNVAIRTIDFLSSGITVSSSNPSVAIAKPICEYLGVPMSCIKADIVVYGLSSGTADITIKNDLNDEVVTFKVIVNKPQADNAKQKLIDYIFTNGLDVQRLAYLVPDGFIEASVNIERKSAVFNGNNITRIEYDPYIDDFRYTYCFEYANSNTEIVWKLIPNEVIDGSYLVRYMEYFEVPHKDPTIIIPKFMIVNVNRKVFDGEYIHFREDTGLFMPPGGVVADDVNKIANDFHKKALESVDNFVKEVIGVSVSEL